VTRWELSRRLIIGGWVILTLVTGVTLTSAPKANGDTPLSKIGPAPEFVLTKCWSA
jgi:hypothetical protein